MLEPWVAQCVSLPSCSFRFICTQIWDCPLHQPLPCCKSSLPGCVTSSPQLPVSAPPTGLDECFFFNSLVVGLPYSLIFCQFWLFFGFLICCCPSFCCARRHSVSTGASILVGSSNCDMNIFITLFYILLNYFPKRLF